MSELNHGFIGSPFFVLYSNNLQGTLHERTENKISTSILHVTFILHLWLRFLSVTSLGKSYFFIFSGVYCFCSLFFFLSISSFLFNETFSFYLYEFLIFSSDSSLFLQIILLFFSHVLGLWFVLAFAFSLPSFAGRCSRQNEDLGLRRTLM